jgi:PIN domain nuclease of toxin-antitoxin system
LIYLDTHVVIWLYAGITSIFSQSIQELINLNDIYISPIVRLEIQYLYEINRVTDKPNNIISDLSSRIGLHVDVEPFDNVINAALAISWTRDPFDRIIVASANLNNHILVSKDKTILANYSLAKW